MFTTGEDSMTRKMTLELAMAYEEQEILYEYHVFQKGPHGYSLANAACADGSSQVMNTKIENYGSTKLGKVNGKVDVTFNNYRENNPTAKYKTMPVQD